MEEHRDWTTISLDVLSIIFKKLGAAELLLSAQAVCRSWRQLSLDTTCQVWRCFDTHHCIYRQDSESFQLFNRYAIDRSGTNVEKLHLEGLYCSYFITYLIGRTPRLKCLALINLLLHEEKVADLLGHCPVLEEIHMYSCYLLPKTFAYIIRSRPELKYLHLDEQYNFMDPEADAEYNYKSFIHGKILPLWPRLSINAISEQINAFKESKENVRSDKIALEIANNLPQLQELSFIRFGITNKGLHAILDKCIELEFLDLRCCFDLRIDDVLQAKLSKIKTVRLSPHSLVSFDRKLNNKMVLSELLKLTELVCRCNDL